MGYFKITDALKRKVDEMQHAKAVDVAGALQHLSFNQTSPVVTAGVSGATASVVAFVAPTKGRVTKVRGIIQVVQTGTGNTPVVQLYNLTQTAVVAASAVVALAGTIGDEIPMVLDVDEAALAEGDVLQARIVNPAGTITVALQALVQVEWNSEA